MGYVVRVDVGQVTACGAGLADVGQELDGAAQVLGRVLRDAGAAVGGGPLVAALEEAAWGWSSAIALLGARGAELAGATQEAAVRYRAVEALTTGALGAGAGPGWPR